MNDKTMTREARHHHLATAGQDRCPYCKADLHADAAAGANGLGTRGGRKA